MTRKNLYLAGFMGTGKSTVGRELARAMGRKFVDMDLELERRLGASIPALFAERGEAWFREQEQLLAAELATTHNRVVATGGGALQAEPTFRLFQQSGLLICLYTRHEELLERLGRSDRRPLLAGGEAAAKVETLLKAREAVYSRIRIRVDTTDLSPMEAARRIVDLLSTRQRILDRLQSQYIDLS